ncbi:type IV toxin-antitoxin system AbiEi family antitoxin domain-containing protein [Dactylosporangium sucinum]|uniref:AbiEi antitoxin N-terminal domain-containing protein n=1 Tax=Dactylosporangium sucinum TaxID=1424081 RepID=A0A917U789_9ACTN|nr:type IV toxin-antitoxin system AbiEi family antitoxin domain-containing protein [Dactylosporangium sucinum]GGM62418.1 hypothetical protein GCM10007977_074990 [Dactylosporangium sucinum]
MDGDRRGVVSRADALRAGISDAVIRRRLASGRWQRVFPGTFVTFSGPVPRETYLDAVVLHAGAGAVLSHRTAAELHGLADEPAPLVHVTVPAGRRPRRAPGVAFHRSGRVERAAHPALRPPRTRVEDTVVDLADTAASLDEAIGWITRACGRRLTTVARLRAAFAERPRVRWRRRLQLLLSDEGDGCHSVLEARYLTDVERPHGLPIGLRQSPLAQGGASEYADVEYAGFGLVVELDGRLAHPDEERARDRRRDNGATEQGRRTLRYGWAEVVGDPCAVAVQVARVLRAAGWRGEPRSCGRSGCTAGPEAGAS